MQNLVLALIIVGLPFCMAPTVLQKPAMQAQEHPLMPEFKMEHKKVPEREVEPEPEPEVEEELEPDPEPVVAKEPEPHYNMTFEATAYTAGPESTGKSPGHPEYGLTASGAYVEEGLTLACPPSLAFGTKIEIEGYGVRVCQDRGGDIVEGRLDIYFEQLSTALDFGRRNVNVRIIQ